LETQIWISQDVLGKSITLNGKSYIIIGVAPGRITGLSPTDLSSLSANGPTYVS